MLNWVLTPISNEFNIYIYIYIYVYISFSMYHIVEDDVSGGPDCARNDILEEELDRWSQNYIDVNR